MLETLALARDRHGCAPVSAAVLGSLQLARQAPYRDDVSPGVLCLVFRSTVALVQVFEAVKDGDRTGTLQECVPSIFHLRREVRRAEPRGWQRAVCC
jgi:hypothetical protein